MPDIHHRIGIACTLGAAFDAVATTTGISRWWTETTGSCSLGGRLNFHFGGTVIIADVTAIEPGSFIEWTVRGDDGQWLDTRIRFDLSEQDEQIFIDFRHSDWRQETEFKAHCSMKWATFLLSLKRLLETGQGRPYPDDIHIDHSEY